MPLTYLDICLGALAAYFLRKLAEKPRRALPPGPRPYPIIGNLLDVAVGRAWLKYLLFKEKYGPITCLKVFGMNIMILNSLDDAIELFDKRSAIYSDRPRLVFGGEMCGWSNTLALLRDVEEHRLHRKNIHRVIGTRAATSKFHSLMEVEMRRLVLRIMKRPDLLQQHVQTSATALILRISHGYSIEPEGSDPLVDIAEKGVSQISMAAQPGAFLVDALPVCEYKSTTEIEETIMSNICSTVQYVPDWMPGAGFKRTAKYFKETVTELVERPFAFVKHQMLYGCAGSSYTRELLEVSDGTPEFEHMVKWSASSLYTGGAETSVGTIQTFFLAMLLNPEVVKKAQQEIDTAIISDRLPTFEDRGKLPYINAICQETKRWHSISPMGLPHVSTQDDIYRGYLIPKGSIILPNIYGFAQDPQRYKRPSEFIPERFIGGDRYGGKPAETDVDEFTFGFGRRICPGNHLADATLFIVAAISLAVFDFKYAKDPDGQDIIPKFEFVPGTLTHPVQFKSGCAPRSEKAARLILSVQEEHPWTSSDPQVLSSIDWKNLATE
ncbi:cytochrome P450 oxidoreductase OrdA-like protein [Schizopora paradoxa]|uniref:Cytochrome P450 oxidoreductase OrdA-like protein n=1 Tax=Schizopora paradoxa TaxID=27342 RepID=A0A0H2S4A4_9AGAM|nr:cytochrome P450 oxidoreductase OrdA-like protein [Schizopora paradoxa]